ncbi:MAG: hypothetical protein DHS20C01_19460 [marine bacterium B5-7]|nr:MAG: hypothetical protein DHS20C01_19460 [marine bacterium B5-7]
MSNKHLRVRSKWRDSKSNVTLEENATALAYIAWQIALDKTRNLHREDFDYEDDDQRTGVLAEYLCFLIHVADRLSFTSLDADARAAFVSTLAQQAARHYQRNLEDVYGHGSDYSSRFIELVNNRIEEYSAYGFDSNQPGYTMMRGLGRHAQDLMGDTQANRWVIDQVMEIDAPEAVLELKNGMDSLFGTANVMSNMNPPE